MQPALVATSPTTIPQHPPREGSGSWLASIAQETTSIVDIENDGADEDLINHIATNEKVKERD